MVNNLWVAEGDPSPDDVPKFPTSLESPYLVRGQSSMDIIGNDKDGLGLREILNDESKTPTNEVDIRTQNGSWVRYLYLPDASTVPHDSKVQILCDSAWGFTLYYPNIRTDGYRQRILSTGDLVTLVVTSDKKQWVAKDDLRHNSYVFGHNFYTATLLPEWVQPGLKLEFAASSGEKGVLEATVGGFTELIITTLDAGFLTEPRNEFTFKDDPTTNREYFETTMASRLVVVQYETMHFTEIMLPTGKFYDAVSDDEGGGYSGDMREHIGKILLSHGIDLANYGISSSFSQTESPHPFTCAFMAAHNTVGMYQNGRIIHGWSGGNGMLTLYESIGNEMSHEVGHNYGLGHYVDGFLGSVHRPADQINSCWGWDSTKNMFVPNFSPAETGNDQCLDGQCEPAFLGKYQYGLDPMAMGDPMWGVNRFSLYTPNVSKRIQKFLEERAVWDPSSSTGFRKYDPSSGEMKEFVNRDNGNKVPRLYRVPVTTIVGYYEPNPDRSLESYIYPALHGAFGFVYDDDGTTSNGTPNGCELVVATNRGALVFDLILSIDPKGMNKFHVNVATEDEPSDAKVYCHNQLLAQRTLDKPKDVLTFTVNGIDFKSDLPTMPPTPSFNPPTFAPSRAPVVSPTVMPTIACVDRDDLKFGKKKRGCAWIAKQRKKKIKKICKRKKWRSKKIREYWCPETCATIGLGPCATNGANAEQEDTIAI